ncbi:MAG: hypothetical protein KKH94_08035 [Candidatus Omnitrophica bacterium]|nr:hypothetical protein [Candidatus Omnitrophota bacterium]
MPQLIPSLSLKGLHEKTACIFACGADIKNRFSFFNNGYIYISDDNEDLAYQENFLKFVNKVREMKDELTLSPDIIAHDLHPSYFSSRVTSIFKNIPCVEVQHHHAHIASMLAAVEVDTAVIGVCFDGTGYGSDGHIWGGEFLVVSPRTWHRSGHLQYLKMPGGDTAVREPWRMAVSLLYECNKDLCLDSDFPLNQYVSKKSWDFLRSMIDKGVNVPLTSSCGRLFDAVSALLGITYINTSEAEAAINLETQASLVDDTQAYSFTVINKDNLYVVSYESFFTELISDLKRKVSTACIARRFHNSLAKLILDMVTLISDDTGLKTVVLSGGVFQNKLLYSLVSQLLKEAGFRLLESNNIPVNDLGICVGQTLVAANTIKNSMVNNKQES